MSYIARQLTNIEEILDIPAGPKIKPLDVPLENCDQLNFMLEEQTSFKLNSLSHMPTQTHIQYQNSELDQNTAMIDEIDEETDCCGKRLRSKCRNINLKKLTISKALNEPVSIPRKRLNKQFSQ